MSRVIKSRQTDEPNWQTIQVTALEVKYLRETWAFYKVQLFSFNEKLFLIAFS